MEYPEGFDTTAKRRGNCGVLATAICAGVSYQVAWAALKRNLHLLGRDRQRMGVRTNHCQRLAAMRELAVKFTEIDAGSVTVKQFAQWAAKYDHNETYMLRVKGHVVTLKNGMIIDQRICIPWQQYNKRKPILNAVRIDGKGW